MKTIKINYGHTKKNSMLRSGLVIIISIMVLTFVYASSQISNDQNSLTKAINDRNIEAQQLNSESLRAVGRSKKLIGMLPQESDSNQLFRDKKELTELYQNNVLPKLKSNLKHIEEIIDQQFWLSQTKVGTALTQTEATMAHIEKFKAGAVFVCIFLTFIILRNQRTEDRKLTYQANTDMLTLLPNRVNQVNNIQTQILQKPDATFAIVFLDIDYFKIINDNYGHDVGDEVLKMFASKIQPYLKKEDILSRFGGDEFVLLLRSIKSEAEANNYIKSLSSALDTSFQVGNIEVFITASIGVSVYSSECAEVCRNPKTLLKHADIAMYAAKQTSRNSYRFFSEETKTKLETEHSICHALHTILRNENKDKELYLKYQPLLNLKDQDIAECEALIRWVAKDGKEILPGDFIPLAEKTNLIEKVNLYVVDEACLQQYRWQQINVDSMRININLSGNKTIFNKLIAQLKANIEKYKLKPSLFGIELTERTLNQISQETIYQLEQLRDEGMKISIDDFGTGYSSFSELKNLPVTTLKIDRSFIKGLPDDKKDHALVKTIIDLGHSLGLDVVAEGVETLAQYRFLKEHSCDVAQGYYYQYPLDGTQLAQLQLCKEEEQRQEEDAEAA